MSKRVNIYLQDEHYEWLEENFAWLWPSKQVVMMINLLKKQKITSPAKISWIDLAKEEIKNYNVPDDIRNDWYIFYDMIEDVEELTWCDLTVQQAVLKIYATAKPKDLFEELKKFATIFTTAPTNNNYIQYVHTKNWTILQDNPDFFEKYWDKLRTMEFFKLLFTNPKEFISYVQGRIKSNLKPWESMSTRFLNLTDNAINYWILPPTEVTDEEIFSRIFQKSN